jgi:predicted glycosyltransferase involved in capsule biosynthesis
MWSSIAKQPASSELEIWKNACFSKPLCDQSNVTVFCITKRAWLGKRILNAIKGFEKHVIDGNGAKSFSELCNRALNASETDFIVITSDKCFPTTRTIEEIQTLLQMGYGLVCAYRFGCFGISKQALNEVGFMDENYLGGGYEDTDMLLRFWESNIAVLETESIPYFPLPSLWKISSSVDLFDGKWKITRGLQPERLREEEASRGDFMEIRELTLLPFNKSRLCRESLMTGIDFSR